MIQETAQKIYFDHAKSANLSGLQRLLLEGINVNSQDQRGYTALHWVAVNHSYECAQLLIEAGANLNIKDNDGETVLHAAIRHKSKDLVKLVIHQGIGFYIGDHSGRTGMHFAILNGDYECVQCLIDNGFNLTISFHGCLTALEMAKEMSIQWIGLSREKAMNKILDYLVTAHEKQLLIGVLKNNSLLNKGIKNEPLLDKLSF